MAETIKITPYSFGGDPNPAVDVDPEGIKVIYQTVRDADLNDQLYTPKLLARVVRAGLEIMTDANMQDLIKDWENNTNDSVIRFTRLPTVYVDDDRTIAVSKSSVTDTRPIPPGVYENGYQTLIFLGSLRIAVTEDPKTVDALLGK